MERDRMSGMLSRRSALRGLGLGTLGLGAAALFGCRSSPRNESNEPAVGGTPTSDTANVLTARTNTSDKAQPGGVYTYARTGDVPSLDPYGNASTITILGMTTFVYPNLVQNKPAVDGSLGTNEIEGQLLEKWEIADPTTVVGTLRGDAKWDSRPPTNSRPVDAEDVVFAWKKFLQGGSTRANYANTVNPAAPIASMEAVDKQRIKIKMAFPYGELFDLLSVTSGFQVVPRELYDGSIDPAKDMRGAGPWIMTKHDRDLRFEFRKNPNFWQKNRPLLDGINIPIIGEPAQRLAQFRAGNLDDSTSAVIQDDVIGLKKEFPNLQVYQGAFRRTPIAIFFGQRPGSPFRDARVRRAVSMMLDRDLLIEVFHNTKALKAAGWPVAARWNSVGVGAGADGYWIDPKGDGLGAAGKAAFSYNVAEAVKLLEAAGFKDKIQTDFNFVLDFYGPVVPRMSEAMIGMLEASGKFQIKRVNPAFTPEWTRDFFYAQGDFNGLAWYGQPGGTSAQHLLEHYHSKGRYQHVAFKGDPKSIEGQVESDALIEKISRTVDLKEKQELVKRWQIENAPLMPQIPTPWPGGMPDFELVQPWVRNYGVFQTNDNLNREWTNLTQRWFDDPAKRQPKA